MRGFSFLSALMIGSLVVAAAMTWWILRDNVTSAARGQTLTIHCAAGIKGPVAEIAKDYEARFGTRVQLAYGGSGTLLSSLRIRSHGDIYIAGDDSYIDTARELGLIAEVLAMATMRPIIAVQKFNPKRVKSYRDLLSPDVRVGLGNPEAAAVGRIAKMTATSLSIWEELASKVTVFKPTVNDLGNDLYIGAIDAAVIWDATARQYDGLEIVDDPRLSRHARQVTLGVLRSCVAPAAALHFARYLTARNEGSLAFARHGFTPIDGDVWADVPRLRLMSGAMLRPAIDATITQFEAREGVKVNRIYNGCGILVSQMKAGTIPDAYFSCDQSFLLQVQDRFEPGLTVSRNEIVMLVARGNPKRLARLADLSSTELRVGLGHPTKSALGALTAALLERTGHTKKLAASGNVAVESATGDLLVNQIVAGSLDVVLVYRSNAAHVLKHCDVIDMEGTAARASQPYAIAKNSDYPRLMVRLLDTIRSAASREQFRSLGFHWQNGQKPK